MKAVFMGTPDFALPSLEVVARQCELKAVYSQPDKPRGRGNKVTPPPVKARALELGIPVLQPLKLRDEAVLAELKAFEPEVIVVVAYAKLIPTSILELPRHGCINVHPSLLPRHRGAIPIQASIMAGDRETGVWTFFMDEGYDTGDLILCRRTEIGPEETGEELSARMALLGAEVLSETLTALASGTAPRIPQPTEGANYSKVLKKEDLWVDWTRPASEVSNFVRALAHEPGATTAFKANQLKLGRATVTGGSGSPGSVLGVEKGQGPVVACGQGAVLIRQLKPPGKGWMDAWAYQQGNPFAPGDLFESRPVPAAT